jgi:hypothetical protein
MLTPLCESCRENEPTVFATYRLRGHDVKVALCDFCSREDIPVELLEQKRAEFGPAPEFHAVRTIYVVVEVRSRDDYFAYQPEKQPVAVFLTQAHAAAFVAGKTGEGCIDLDWEIVPTPLAERPHDFSEANTSCDHDDTES